jgi:hypothetical protein
MPMPTGKGKRILRFFLFAGAGILGFFVVIFVSARVATNAMFQGIASERATGLSANMESLELAQSPRLIQSADDLEIVRVASLMLETREFDAVRGRLESVVRSHEGHFDQLQVGVRQDSGRTLIATLRVPVEGFDSTLAELKALGSAEEESQTSSSSFAESDRLDAKLAAARFTVNRLNQLSREHVGKLGEYLEVEQAIAKIRNEIEDLEAQQRRHAQRVRYGAVRISLKEEYVARFRIERAFISARLRSSIVDGLQGVIRQGSGALSLVLLFAPSLLFWAALLYWPVRLGWRRLRGSLATRKATTVPVQP